MTKPKTLDQLRAEKERAETQLAQELHKRVIGQDEAITAVSDAVRRSRAGLQPQRYHQQ